MKKVAVLTMILGYTMIVYGQRLSPEKIKPMSHDTLIKYMQQTMHDFAIPGIAVSIFTGDKILNEQVSGLRKLNTNDSIKISDRFYLGSCGKAMTGFVAGRLVEKGLIKWDTKVLDVFPEFKDSSNLTYLNITLNDVLSHRARVKSFNYSFECDTLRSFHGINTKTRRYDFIKWLLKQSPVEIDSVKKYTYSDAGYAVAASMMEKITGKAWNDLIADELFNPLNMTVTIGWPALYDKNQPWGHKVLDGDSILIPQIPNIKDYQDYDDEILAPAGDYAMSIIDYTKFLQLNLIGLNGKDSILKTTTFNYLHYCNFDYQVPLFTYYSIGWAAFKTKGGLTVSKHDGSDETFYCCTTLFKEVNLGVTITANSGDKNAMIGLHTLKDRIVKYYR